MSSIIYWILAIIMFGVVIMLHEFGHFIMARMTGVTVLEFAVGFGPKLLSRKAKSGVTYSLRALPLGGYCRFVGEEDDGMRDREDAFAKAKIWKRALISIGGPLMNVLTAIVLLFLLCVAVGLPAVDTPYISGVTAGMPASEAGIQVEDRFVSVNGQPVTAIEDVSDAMALVGQDEAVTFEMSRDGEIITINVVPQWVEAESRGVLGIEYRYGIRYIRQSFGESVKNAFVMTGDTAMVIIDVLRDLITTGEGMDELSGPIGTVTEIKRQTEAGGLFNYIYLAAIISVNLGLFNMLPIPGLDGSKLIFLLIEKIRGKPLDPKYEGIVTLIGFGLILCLMVFALYQDIVRLIG